MLQPLAMSVWAKALVSFFINQLPLCQNFRGSFLLRFYGLSEVLRGFYLFATMLQMKDIGSSFSQHTNGIFNYIARLRDEIKEEISQAQYDSGTPAER